MAWIKFEKDLQTDPRVLRIARAVALKFCLQDRSDSCNASALPAVTLVCGALVRLWCLADSHVSEDDILALPATEIDAHIGIAGFCAIMPADWFEDLGETVKLPGFHVHNGTEAKKKSVTQKRVERHRSRNAQALQAVTPSALPDQTRPDHIKNTRASNRALNGAFNDFWKAYPRKKNKGTAEKAWLSIKPDEQLTERICASVERAKTSADWKKNGGQYIPHPATWLRAKGWEDQLGEPARQTGLSI